MGVHINHHCAKRNLVVLVEAVPEQVGELADGQLDADALRLAAERRQRIAVTLVGMDEVTQTGNRLVILVEKALVRGAVRGEVLEDGQAVGAVRVDHARDAGGVVGCIRLKLAGAERLKVALALLEVVHDGIGLDSSAAGSIRLLRRQTARGRRYRP